MDFKRAARFFSLLGLLFLVASCGGEKKESIVSKEKIERLSVVFFPIGNTQVKGLMSIDLEGSRLVYQIHMAGLLRDKQFHLRIHRYGDLAAIDGSSVGDVLGVPQKTETPKEGAVDSASTEFDGQKIEKNLVIGDVGGFESDQDGSFTGRLAGAFVEDFSTLAGRSVILTYVPTDRTKEEVKIGFGVIGISSK